VAPGRQALRRGAAKHDLEHVPHDEQDTASHEIAELTAVVQPGRLTLPLNRFAEELNSHYLLPRHRTSQWVLAALDPKQICVGSSQLLGDLKIDAAMIETGSPTNNTQRYGN
jgi:hypothetical protein